MRLRTTASVACFMVLAAACSRRAPAPVGEVPTPPAGATVCDFDAPPDPDAIVLFTVFDRDLVALHADSEVARVHTFGARYVEAPPIAGCVWSVLSVTVRAGRVAALARCAPPEIRHAVDGEAHYELVVADAADGRVLYETETVQPTKVGVFLGDDGSLAVDLAAGGSLFIDPSGHATAIDGWRPHAAPSQQAVAVSRTCADTTACRPDWAWWTPSGVRPLSSQPAYDEAAWVGDRLVYVAEDVAGALIVTEQPGARAVARVPGLAVGAMLRVAGAARAGRVLFRSSDDVFYVFDVTAQRVTHFGASAPAGYRPMPNQDFIAWLDEDGNLVAPLRDGAETGTNGGLYRSTDDGATWHLVGRLVEDALAIVSWRRAGADLVESVSFGRDAFNPWPVLLQVVRDGEPAASALERTDAAGPLQASLSGDGRCVAHWTRAADGHGLVVARAHDERVLQVGTAREPAAFDSIAWADGV